MADDRKPTHEVYANEKGGGSGRALVGVGWEDADGSISVRLNVGTTLSWNDGLYIRIRPKKAAKEPPATG